MKKLVGGHFNLKSIIPTVTHITTELTNLVYFTQNYFI